MTRRLIVIRDTDTEPDLIETWRHIARTIPGDGRTQRCDALLDEVLGRREAQHG